MVSMKMVLCWLAFTLITGEALAAGVIHSAKVLHIRIDQDGKGMVVFDQQVGNTPASCANVHYANAFSFNASTPGGKGIMAMVLAAKAAGTPITAYGTGACAVYGGAHVEDWSYGISY